MPASKERYLQRILSFLKPEQRVVYDEAIISPRKVLSLPMGFGKTITSLAVMMHNLNQSDDPVLIVAAKALLGNWDDEIIRFLGPNFPYKILHKDYNKDNSLDGSWVYLCTPNPIAREYKAYNIYNSFVYVEQPPRGPPIHHYEMTTRALADEGIFYSRHWSMLIIDEGQKYTNIRSDTSKALITLWAEDVRLLSGTIIDDPKSTKLLGYYMMIKCQTVPNSMEAFSKHIRKKDFEGIKQTMIHRDKIDSFIVPKINEVIVDHGMNKGERGVYLGIRESLLTINRYAKEEADRGNTDTVYHHAMLPMISKIRQCVLCPIIPLTKISLDVCKTDSPISRILLEELNKRDLGEYLDDEESIASSRVMSQVDILEDHHDERVVIFSAFRVYLDLIHCMFSEGFERPIINMESKDSAKKRSAKIEQFRNSSNGVMLITYDMGAEGLNLQFCSVAFITDMWWNCAKIQQAIARILRPGQESDTVSVYIFTSNTAIENCMLKKQNDKQTVTDSVMNGTYTGKINKMSLDDIVQMVSLEANNKLIADNRYCVGSTSEKAREHIEIEGAMLDPTVEAQAVEAVEAQVVTPTEPTFTFNRDEVVLHDDDESARQDLIGILSVITDIANLEHASLNELMSIRAGIEIEQEQIARQLGN
jgi:SNF2 family DNA or RNA helicase